jgi:hypothetical protein
MVTPLRAIRLYFGNDFKSFLKFVVSTHRAETVWKAGRDFVLVFTLNVA